jgi:hypothetical protein
MGEKRFGVDITWPVVALVAVILAVIVTAVRPDIWAEVTESAVRVIRALRGR